MVPISDTGSVPKTVTWYWHFVCTEPNFSTWRDILQKSAFTSWYLTVISWNLVYQRIDNFLFKFQHTSILESKLGVKNFGVKNSFDVIKQFWSQKQLKTNWAHFFEHKERPQCANIWQSLASSSVFWSYIVNAVHRKVWSSTCAPVKTYLSLSVLASILSRFAIIKLFNKFASLSECFDPT